MSGRAGSTSLSHAIDLCTMKAETQFVDGSPPQYIEGIRLFNAGEFWHAHEQWEACWMGSPEPAKTFYQGIIQAAAALVHWKKGNPRGLRRNWEKGRPKLVALPGTMHGLDLRRLIVDMDLFVAAGGPPARVPQLRMVDASE
jgi:predicted metal-dependent hydrolase